MPLPAASSRYFTSASRVFLTCDQDSLQLKIREQTRKERLLALHGRAPCSFLRYVLVQSCSDMLEVCPIGAQCCNESYKTPR